MTRRLPLLVLVCVAAVVGSQCGPTGMPMLSVSGPTSAYRDGTPITLRVVATTSDGKVGRGQVTVTTDVGVVMDEGLTLDEFGTASFTFACNVATTPDCIVNSANLKLRWTTTPPVALDYAVRLTSRSGVGDGGAGGGGGFCASDSYSRNMCQGNQKATIDVRCCLGAGSIPDCNSEYVCDGKKLIRRYREVLTGQEVDLELEFRFATNQPPTYADCMQQKVGVIIRRDGVAVDGLYTDGLFGWAEHGGDYFTFRSASKPALVPTYRDREDRECLAIADGGVAGGWSVVGSTFSRFVAPGVPPADPPLVRGLFEDVYVPLDGGRVFFFTSLRVP